MSDQFPTIKASSYRPTLEVLLQQKGSKFMKHDAVRMETQEVETDYYDRLGSVAGRKKTGRAEETKRSNTPTDRRQVTTDTYYVADTIDRKDNMDMVADPTGGLVRVQAFALGRDMDGIIRDKFFGTAKSGKSGGTSVAFPSSQVVPAEYVETGSDTDSDLTIGKLRRGLNLLEEAHVDVDEEQLFCAYTPNQKQSLLRTTEVTSADFNTVRALVDGKVDTFLATKFITFSTSVWNLTTSTAGTGGSSTARRIPMWVKSGMLLSKNTDIIVEIDRLPGNTYATQVYSEFTAGGTRMEEEKVVEIECIES